VIIEQLGIQKNIEKNKMTNTNAEILNQFGPAKNLTNIEKNISLQHFV